jgi:hypothetical protein
MRVSAIDMNWENVASNWPSFRRRLHQRWTRLSDHDLESIGAGRERVVQALQARYGISAELADALLLEWQRDMDEEAPTLVQWGPSAGRASH